MKPSIRPLLLCLVAWLVPTAIPVLAAPAAASGSPPRLLVLSDIEADPDDTQSFVRLFLYANEIELQGLVATTSVWKRDSIAPESIHALIDAYAKVHGNLLLHDKRYPTAEALHGLVRKGRPEYGMLGVGEGKDTEGSARIIELLERADDRPLWVSVWGGANTLAQALHTLRATRGPAEVDRLVAKLRVYTISDQDDSGPWLRANFPGLFYIVTPGGDYGSATWAGINTFVEGIDNSTISNRWIAENLQQGHGPLGAAYPDVAWGVEGDTPAFLGLIPNGLNTPEHPEWGGWGGRYTLQQPVVPVADEKTFLAGKPIPQETRPIWTNAVDDYAPTTFPEYGRGTRLGEKPFRSAQASLWRWRDEFQRDFAARMDWTVRPFGAANHPPVPMLDCAATITVSSGQSFGFDARHSHDPDGDSLSFLWMPYREAGSSDAVLKINGTENAVLVSLTAPEVTKTETCHLILKVTDRGSPALTRYQRIVVIVTPKAR
jgi:hypothetical protein